MVKPLVFEGTKEEVSRQLQETELNGRLRIIVDQIESVESVTDLPKSGRSLADSLGDIIGSVKGTGRSDASRVSEEFAEYLLEKKLDGRL